jgi:hypothetical protein
MTYEIFENNITINIAKEQKTESKRIAIFDNEKDAFEYVSMKNKKLWFKLKNYIEKNKNENIISLERIYTVNEK